LGSREPAPPFYNVPKNGGAGCARTGRVGQAHIKSVCALAQTALHCASGRRFDYGARGFNVITLLPLVEFSNGDANQKLPFLFSPFGGVVGGGAVQRNGRKFLGLPARVRERG